MTDELYKEADEKVKKDPALKQSVQLLLSDKASQASQVVMELDARMSKTNFQTNGAASIAVLAFIGSGKSPNFLYSALLVFVAGVIAAALQVRFQHKTYIDYGDRLSKARHALRKAEFNLASALDRSGTELIYERLEIGLGWLSQGLFVAGVLLSTWAFLK